MWPGAQTASAKRSEGAGEAVAVAVVEGEGVTDALGETLAEALLEAVVVEVVEELGELLLEEEVVEVVEGLEESVPVAELEPELVGEGVVVGVRVPEGEVHHQRKLLRRRPIAGVTEGEGEHDGARVQLLRSMPRVYALVTRKKVALVMETFPASSTEGKKKGFCRSHAPCARAHASSQASTMSSL